MSQKFCVYKFISGPKKGLPCARFCRSGRDLCFSHNNQMNKNLKKKSKVIEEVPIDELSEEVIIKHTLNPKKEEIIATTPQKQEEQKPKVELLTLSKKKVKAASSSSSDSSTDSSDTY
jgi:hypothetical protein